MKSSIIILLILFSYIETKYVDYVMLHYYCPKYYELKKMYECLDNYYTNYNFNCDRQYIMCLYDSCSNLPKSPFELEIKTKDYYIKCEIYI